MLINIIGLASIIAIFILSIALAYKMEKIEQQRSAIDKLNKSLDEMDEQAKLIVRTDIELNKAQEELDKKITGLYALQRLSRSISTTMEESQIFKRIDANHLEDIGFERACGFLWDDTGKKFKYQLNIGYSESDINTINSFVNLHKDKYLNLISGTRTASSISVSAHIQPLMKDIKHIFKAGSFVISAILPKEGEKGFLFVGTEEVDAFITEGDEELITILSNELGQALENARLFEKTWRSQQDLEKKVEERTRELSRALEEVKLISKRKTDFISSVSHELRTPLTSIKGYASILLAGKLGAFTEEAKIRIEKINQHSDELVHFINDLLDLSRIESGKVAMKQEKQDLKIIADEVADLLSVQLKEKSIALSMDISLDTHSIFADREQIKRVFINIVGNAIKFTPQNGKITIHSKKIDKYVQVDITDTGCGIPPEAEQTIFEEFYRVDNAINQQVKGSGIGLTLVKHIIEAHNGKIWVKSKMNSGSTFSFTLTACLI